MPSFAVLSQTPLGVASLADLFLEDSLPSRFDEQLLLRPFRPFLSTTPYQHMRSDGQALLSISRQFGVNWFHTSIRCDETTQPHLLHPRRQ